MALQFIYFDLGNVLLTFDQDLACRQMGAVAELSADEVQRVVYDEGRQQRYERGELTAEQFCQEFRQRTGRPVDSQAFLEAGSAMFQLNVPIVPIVAQLRFAGYPLGILSNTCPSHWAYVSQGRYAVIRSYFRLHVLSYEVGALKPELALFQRAIAAAGVPAGQIFFTDDRPEHVAGACAAGLDAVWFQSAQQLIDELDRRGVAFNL